MTELKIYLKPLTDKNAQLVTRYIKNWADSAKRQFFNMRDKRFDLSTISDFKQLTIN